MRRRGVKSKWPGIIVWVIMALIFAAALLGLWAEMARAHDFYSAQCCHGAAQHGDCEPMPPEAVQEMKNGWQVDFVSPTQGEIHEFVRADSPNVYDSQDGRFHVCLLPSSGYATASRIRCFYRAVNS